MCPLFGMIHTHMHMHIYMVTLYKKALNEMHSFVPY